MPAPKPYTSRDGVTTWRVRFRLGSRSTSETFPNEGAAKVFCQQVDSWGAARAVAELNRRDRASGDYVPTLREWWQDYLDKYLVGVTDGTRRDYERTANRVLLPMLGDLPLDMIDRATDVEFIKRLQATPALDNRGRPLGHTLSPKTISQHHGLLSNLLNIAVTEGVIKTNPCRGTKLPRQGEQDRQDERFLTYEEFAAIHDALRTERDRALALCLVGTGLRWAEATALQVRHVNFRLGTIRVAQAWKRGGADGRRSIGPPKSRKSNRTVNPAAQVMEALAPLCQGQPADAFVFRTTTGTALFGGPFHTRSWAPACEAAGVTDPRPRLHDLRHTHASWMIDQGASLEEVQDQLGHESFMTTRKIYGALQPKQRARTRAAATAAISAALSPRQVGS